MPRHARLHAVAVEVPVGEVLAAADASADAGLAAHDLGDEPVEISRIRQEVPVVTMIRQHHVVRMVERSHDRHLAQLLAEAGVRGAREQALGEELEQQLLGPPNEVPERVEGRRVERKARLALIVAIDSRQRDVGMPRARSAPAGSLRRYNSGEVALQHHD